MTPAKPTPAETVTLREVFSVRTIHSMAMLCIAGVPIAVHGPVGAFRNAVHVVGIPPMLLVSLVLAVCLFVALCTLVQVVLLSIAAVLDAILAWNDRSQASEAPRDDNHGACV